MMKRKQLVRSTFFHPRPVPEYLRSDANVDMSTVSFQLGVFVFIFLIMFLD
jgi:hypothetical protein